MGAESEERRLKAIVVPSGDQAGERSNPPVRSCAGLCPRAFAVKSEIAGSTTDSTSRVKAMRFPSGEMLGITSNGPCVIGRATPPLADTDVEPEAVVAPVGQVALEDEALPVGRPDRARVAAEVLARRWDRDPAQALAVRPHGVEAADAAVHEPEGDPALRRRAVRTASRSGRSATAATASTTLTATSIRAAFGGCCARDPVGRSPAMGGNGRFVYGFEEPSEGGRELLGGKGVGLAEMTQLGVPVPAGFTITTDACRAYMQDGQQLPRGARGGDRRAPGRRSSRRRASASAIRPTRCSSPSARERRSRCPG